MFQFFIFQQLRQIKRYFSKKSLARGITAILFLVILFFVAFGLYSFFRNSFLYVSKQYFFGEALTMYVLEMFFAVISGLCLAGSLITLWLWLFRGNQQGWIMSSPSFKKMPWLITWRVFVANSWPVLVIVLPMILAMKKVFGISVFGMFGALGVSLLLFFLVTLFSLALILLCANILHSISKKIFNTKTLAWAVGVCLVVLAWGAFWSFSHVDLQRRFASQDLSLPKASVEKISQDFVYLPSHSTAQIFWNIAYKDHSKTLLPTAVSLLWIAVLLGISGMVSKKFLALWQSMQEQADLKKRYSKANGIIASSKSALGAMLGKEIVLSFRNQKNLLWLLFMMLIWALQSALTFMMAKNLAEYELMLPKLPAQVYGLQIAMVAFFVTSLCLRFAYPSFSSEGKTSWLLGSVPLSLNKLYFSKLMFFVPFATISGLLLSIANTRALNISLMNSTLFLSLVVVCGASIGIFAVSLGAKFANFSTDDPQILSTSLPGLLYTFGSLAYGALGAFGFYKYLLPGGSMNLIKIFWLVSLVLVVACIMLAVNGLKHKEFSQGRE
jgi:hypothetical protein